MSPYNSDTIEIYTGLYQNQFDSVLVPTFQSLLDKFHDDNKSMHAIYAYLMKLRTNHTYKQMAPHFSLSPRTISSWVSAVREIMYEKFVPLHLFNRNREHILANTTDLSRKLYNVNETTAMLIWDGTYVYTIKSSNFEFQRNTYSMQKKRNLVKFMLCVTTNGLIVAVYGPYDAKTNDATILNQILLEPNNIFQSLHDGDVMIVDRGFRDCVRELQKRFVVKIPALTKKSNNQLTNKQANDSRTVTKTRFVVEARNTHIKNKWTHLNGISEYQSIPYLMKDFNIAAALVNAFGAKIISDANDWERMAVQMLTQIKQPNNLSKHIHKIPRNAFAPVNDLTLFPKLNFRDLKDISQGTYQIKQAPSYCQSHLKANNGHFVTNVSDDANCKKYISELIKPHSNSLLLLTNLSSRF